MRRKRGDEKLIQWQNIHPPALYGVVYLEPFNSFSVLRAAIFVISGFHYPSSRAARVQGPSSRPVNSGAFSELTARVDGCQKMHRSSRAVNSARKLGPWTRVVETGLNSLYCCLVRQNFVFPCLPVNLSPILLAFVISRRNSIACMHDSYNQRLSRAWHPVECKLTPANQSPCTPWPVTLTFDLLTYY